jgi:hypothetical protein
VNSEEMTIYELGSDALSLYNSLINDLSVPLLIHIAPPRVMHHECQIVLQEAMETNVVTSSGSPHNPSTTITTGGILPPNSPS